MKTQEALVQNTFQGLIICFVMAFVVLILSTMDLRVGFIATLTIAGIVTTVMGVGVKAVMGWSLGIGESIAAVILIGLSVDYCVHLANAYIEAPAHMTTREARAQHALMIMGVSITASAVTTIISGRNISCSHRRLLSLNASVLPFITSMNYMCSPHFALSRVNTRCERT